MASQAARRIMPARTSSFADDNEVNRSLMARALQLFGRPPACARLRPPAPAVRRRPKWTHAATSVIKGRPRRRQPAGEATVFFPSSSLMVLQRSEVSQRVRLPASLSPQYARLVPPPADL